jgi:hypothetical protein
MYVLLVSICYRYRTAVSHSLASSQFHEQTENSTHGRLSFVMNDSKNESMMAFVAAPIGAFALVASCAVYTWRSLGCGLQSTRVYGCTFHFQPWAEFQNWPRRVATMTTITTINCATLYCCE